ncbi:MAG: lytic transglycosylase domain-containing protein [Thermodesulfobacteriota bacterium]|nr:lytic transglycosylase domain-containing protein [Thermodesulfobacteriota bacterium]
MRLLIVAAVILYVILIAKMSQSFCFCFYEAGETYNISPALLKAISQVESNMHPHAINHNANGSVDYCHMQINSYWKQHLKDRWQYLSDPCYCTMVGAWILKQCIIRYGYNLNAIACYHSGRGLSRLNTVKRERTIKYLRKINDVLTKAYQ